MGIYFIFIFEIVITSLLYFPLSNPSMFPSPSTSWICDIYTLSYNLQTDFSVITEVDKKYTPQKFIIANTITFTAI